jgi:hypothetical protein
MILMGLLEEKKAIKEEDRASEEEVLELLCLFPNEEDQVGKFKEMENGSPQTVVASIHRSTPFSSTSAALMMMPCLKLHASSYIRSRFCS